MPGTISLKNFSVPISMICRPLMSFVTQCVVILLSHYTYYENTLELNTCQFTVNLQNDEGHNLTECIAYQAFLLIHSAYLTSSLFAK